MELGRQYKGAMKSSETLALREIGRTLGRVIELLEAADGEEGPWIGSNLAFVWIDPKTEVSMERLLAEARKPYGGWSLSTEYWRRRAKEDKESDN